MVFLSTFNERKGGLENYEQSSSTLVSRVLKAKYFRDTNFFNATLGFKPSPCWRSIFKAIPLLQEGSVHSDASHELPSWKCKDSGEFTMASQLHPSQGQVSDNSQVRCFWKTTFT